MSARKNPTPSKNEELSIPSDSLEQELQDTYNDYLLALMKNHIVKQQFEEVKTVLGDQLAIEREALAKDKLELQRLEMEHKIELEKRRITTATENLQKQLQDLKKACDTYQFEKSANAVIEVLSEVGNRVVLENVVADDPDEIVKQMDFLSAELRKILGFNENRDKIRELAESLQTTLCLKEQIINKNAELQENSVELGSLLMKALSNYFANQSTKM